MVEQHWKENGAQNSVFSCEEMLIGMHCTVSPKCLLMPLSSVKSYLPSFTQRSNLFARTIRITQHFQSFQINLKLLSKSRHKLERVLVIQMLQGRLYTAQSEKKALDRSVPMATRHSGLHVDSKEQLNPPPPFPREIQEKTPHSQNGTWIQPSLDHSQTPNSKFKYCFMNGGIGVYYGNLRGPESVQVRPMAKSRAVFPT